MKKEIEDKIKADMNKMWNLPEFAQHLSPLRSTYMAGAKRGYELAMLEAKKLKDALENIMVMVGSSELSKSDWKYYDEVKLLIANDSPTPEPGKEYTREQMIELLEFTCYKFGREKALGWFKTYPFDPNKQRTYLTTEDLVTEYLNSKK